MTPEEQAERERLIEEIERKRLIKKIEAQRTAPQPQPAEPGFEPSWKDRAEMVTQGATLNLGDELYSGLSALGGEIRDVFSDDQGQTLGSRFTEKHQALNRRREAYREANPGEALALELAGGLTTGGVGLGRTLAAKGLSTGARLARGVGIGAGEGAVAGFGSSAGGLEDRMASAGAGGLTGAAMTGALGAGGAGLRALGKRRVAQDLVDESGRFTPIPMAEGSGVLGDVYRQGVRRIWGAQDKLDTQGQWIMDRGERRLRRALGVQEGRAGQIEPARFAAADAGTAAKREFEDAAMSQIDQRAAQIQDDLAAAKTRVAEGDTALQRQIDEAVSGDRASFRRDAFDAALPERADPEFRIDTRSKNPESARKSLKDWWSKNGFEQAKKQAVRWDDELTEDMKFLVGSEPTLSRSVYEDIVTLPGMRKRIENMRKSIAADRGVEATDIPVQEAAMKMLESPHQMSGSTFMAIRNNFARNANKSSDGWTRTKMRRVVDALDQRMEDALPDDLRADFLADKANYRNFVHYNDAVKQGFSKRGAFDESDWLAVAKRNAEAPGVEQARGVEDVIAGRQAAAETRRQGLQRTLAQAEKQAAEANAALRKARKAATRKAADVGRTARRDSPALKKAKAAKARADKRVSDATAEMKRLKALRGPDSTSGLSALLTTMTAGGLATLGALGAGPAAGAAAAVAGTRLGSALTRPGVQRALAGQTRGQEALARALRSPASQIVPTAISRTAAAQSGDNDTLED